MAEIINLDNSSDEEISQVVHKKKRFKCLNPDCRTSENLFKANISDRRYFGVLAFPKKTKICYKCSTTADNKKKLIVDLIRSGKNIMDKVDIMNNKTVVNFDSDSDKTDDDDIEIDTELEYDLTEICEYYNETALNSESDDSNQQLQFAVSDIISKMNLNEHINESRKIIQNKLSNAEKEFDKLNDDFKSIENNLDHLRSKFYQTFQSHIKWLPTLEIGPPDSFNESADVMEVTPDLSRLNFDNKLAPLGQLAKPLFNEGEKAYAMLYSSFSSWSLVTIVDNKMENISEGSETFYVISYKIEKNKMATKNISGKLLAYTYECPTRIPVRTRIIAAFKDNDNIINHNVPIGSNYFVGIIAELPTCANKYRYLVFFDDGYAQYVNHSNIRVVSYSSMAVWEDINTESKEFIKEYLQTYPERPMVRLQIYDYIKTELNGKWFNAQVLEVDGSLAKMSFPKGNKVEWIYRGSTRLGPLYNKKMNMHLQSEQADRPKIIRRRTIPTNKSGTIVEYINFNKDEENLDQVSNNKQPVEKRAVAKKSTAAKSNLSVAFVHMKENLVLESRGEFVLLDLEKKSNTFSPHQCGSHCIKENLEILKNKSPLFKPILTGWRRQTCKQKKKTLIHENICYIAPCGRRLRTLEEVFRYLRLTQSKLTIDCFIDDTEIVVEREWVPNRVLYSLEDITLGKEDCSISCINAIDDNRPKALIYSSVRQPSINVGLNTDSEFLVCCSCTDDCQDKSQCECWQLTIESTRLFGGTENPDVGYKFRRLHQQVITGVYECNSNCSCKSSCLNRVVQFPIRQKLQLFKTARRGWGVRTLHDLPKGAFISLYVGRVLTETEANEDGMTDGADDYYAELDFIEVIEGMKEGYESDVEENEDEDLSEEFNNVDKAKKRSESERVYQTFEPRNLSSNKLSNKVSHKGTREYFGAGQQVFILDAKMAGNIGRYLNHSCNPNAFVQNVFVDTHDPRFPWIAFFAATNIKAGSELTWDYNYEVDSVPGKIKYCYCQSGNCRGRLL